MKKNKIILLIMITFCAFCLISCNDSKTKDSGKVSITEFNVPTDDVVDIGTLYTLNKVSARDDQGGYYMAQVSVVDPDGLEVEVNKFAFTCSKFGQYTVTYTVTYNETETLSRSYKLEVMDVSEPSVTTDLFEHNISTVGKTVDLDCFEVTDNSGEEITHTTKVYFNGELDESSLENNVLTLTKEGCYTIEVTASDSNNNEVLNEYNIYTVMDFEAGYYFNNPSYSSEITNKDAYDGNSSYSIGAFDNHYSYFNDFSMLGCVQVLDKTMRYVSFWIKFQNPDYANILKARYHDLVIYDEFGDLLPAYPWQNTTDTGYELYGDRWYKVVVELNNVVNKGEVEDAPGEIIANPQSLDLIPFYWGVWDSQNNTNASKAQRVLIDNIMLTNDPKSGFKTPEKSDYQFPTNCIADFESAEQLTALVGSWNTKLSYSSEIVSSGTNSLKFLPYAQWSHFGIKGLLGVDELVNYNSMTAKIYIEDNSERNVYDTETYVVVDLRHTFDNETYTIVSSTVINETNSWIDLEFALGAYNQYSLSDRGFDIAIYKIVDGVALDTGDYSDFAVYIDDLYVKN